MVAAALILGETYRGSRSRANARDKIEEQIEALQRQVDELNASLSSSENSLQLSSSPPKGLSNEQQTLYSLIESVQLMWKLAERNGWLESQSLTQEIQRALQGDDSEPGRETHPGDSERSSAPVPSAHEKASTESHAPSASPSLSSPELGEQRARAVIEEIRLQTSPTPIQLPRLPTSDSTASLGVFSWLLPLSLSPSYMRWMATPGFDIMSPFS